MDSSTAVRTASKDRNCRHCSEPLPERPASAKEHHFCNAKCRAAWHRGERQRRLNEALRRTVALHRSTQGQALAYELSCLVADLVAAGAEPS